MPKVYVSATFRDLEECRSAVVQALRRLNVQDVAMESYSAEDRPPVEKCLDDVAECDIYVGIFAWRYGYVPSGYDKSITELEYREAVRLRKQCLIFMLDESAPWPVTYVDRGADGERIEALRAELADQRLCSMFTGPADLAALVTASVANLIRKMGDSTDGLHKLSPEMTRRYYDRLHQQYGGLDLDALTPPQRDEYLQMRLTSVYIEQSVREEAPPVELPREWLQRMQAAGHLDSGDVPDEVDADELALLHEAYRAKPLRRLFDVVVAPERRAIVLLGDPGSGKSTAARYVALALAQTSTMVDDRLSALTDHLPLFIELRSYVALTAEGQAGTFVDYLDHRARTDGLGLEKGALVDYLSGGLPSVVIFDGLDEVFDRRRREAVANQIAAFAGEYPQVRIIVTSRIIGYSRRGLSELGFAHFTLQDLDEDQIDDFLGSWYRLAMPDRPGDAAARRARLLEAMRHSHSIRELAGNPMLLTILAIIGKHQALPRERWKLYDHAASVLVEHWDVNRHLQDRDDSPDFIDAEDKKELLRRLAYRMQAGEPGLSANYIPSEELSEVFEEYLIDRYRSDPAVARSLARSMINQFRERNFILSRYGPLLYGFVHRTFLEFFCAEAVVAKFKHDQQWSFDQVEALYLEHWADPSWREVLRLVAGALHERHTARLITLLTRVNQPWPAGEFAQPPWNVALAVQCLAEVRHPHSDVAEPARELLNQVILLLEHCVSINDRDTMNLIEEEILPAARAIGTGWPGGEAYVAWYRRRGVRLIWSLVSAHAARLAAVLTPPGEHVEELFGGVLAGIDDRPAAYASVAGLAELAHVANTATNRSAYALALAKARDLLVARARGDHHAGVRLAAVEALGDRFTTDAHARDVLVERATADVNPTVRLAALRALAPRIRDDQAVRALALDRLAEDEPDRPREGDPGVRRAAVRALERLPFDDAVRAALVDRVRRDRDPEVVAGAGRAMHDRGGAGADAALQALVERMRTERAGPIRRAVVRVLAERTGGIPAVADLLLHRLREDRDAGVLGAAARALVERLGAGADTRDVLIDRARGDGDEVARLAMVQIAREHFGADPRVRAAFMERARVDRAADVRLAAIRALADGLATDVDGATALGEVACTDADASVRLEAVQTLVARIGLDEAVCGVLQRVIREDGDAGVRTVAVQALAARCAGDARVRRRLMERARRDSHPDVRGAAIAALAAHTAALPDVAELLVERTRDDPDGAVFAAAAAAAGDGTREVIAHRMANDPNPRVREAAVRALVARVSGASARDLLLDRVRVDPDPLVMAEAAIALVASVGADAEQCDLLLVRAAGTDPAERLAAVRVLGESFGGEPAVREVLVTLARDDDDVKVRREALRVLNERLASHDEVRQLLVERVRDRDWSVRKDAVRGLCEHYGTDPEIRALLVELARDDPDPNFRRVAGQALSGLPGATPIHFPDIE